jgi:hypothetical protein
MLDELRVRSAVLSVRAGLKRLSRMISKNPPDARSPWGDRIGETHSGHWKMCDRDWAPKLTDNHIEVFGRSRE